MPLNINAYFCPVVINKISMEDVLKRIILENQELVFKKTLIKRNIELPDTDHIKVFVGIRRSGKTYTLYEQAQKVEKENILFLDFEDERLLALQAKDNYDVILDSYKSLYPDKKPVLFFDEIQNLNNWHLFLKRLHVADYQIFVTGSNANMLSSDIATFLKGRSLEIRIFPFSFVEFLKIKQFQFNTKDLIINVPVFLNYFEDYLKYGGFPEVILAEEKDKRSVAQNIYNLLYYKDLVTRFDKNEYLVKLLVNKIVENITKEFSISSIAEKVNAVYKTSIPTVTDYFSILPLAFLTSNIHSYKNSFMERQRKRKTYLEDNSFIFLNRIGTDLSRLFENLVFNSLQRKYGPVHYYVTNNKKEVDFIVFEKEQTLLFQASYSISDMETLKRETNALKKAMIELKINNAYILTNNQSETLENDFGKIKVFPLWKWLLEGASKN
jgi:predicted AAA+ superfamily ATPase